MSLPRKTALRRTHPMARDRPIARAGRKPLKAKRRPKAEAERIYGPKAFRDWLHAQPCAVCGWRGRSEQMQQAHAKTGGTSRKDDWTRTLPLCGPHVDWGEPMARYTEGCHRESGSGVRTFEKQHGVRLLKLAAETQENWQAYTNRNSA